MPVPTWADSETLLLGQADEGLFLGPDEEEVPRRQVLTIPQVKGEASIQGPCRKHRAGHLPGAEGLQPPVNLAWFGPGCCVMALASTLVVVPSGGVPSLKLGVMLGVQGTLSPALPWCMKRMRPLFIWAWVNRLTSALGADLSTTFPLAGAWME